MKQKLLLMVLVLGLFCINVSAQTKEYKVADDGFEWYLVESRDKATYMDYYGAQDKYGNTIISTIYNQLFYFNGFFNVRKGNGSNNEKWGIMDIQGNLIVPIEYGANELLTLGKGQFRYIQAIKGNHMGIYNMYGKCIIPFSRGYNNIFQRQEDCEDNLYYECFHGDTKYDYKSNAKRKYSICDASGKVVFTTKKECESVFVINDVQRKKYTIVRDGIYFVDKDDNILLEPRGFTIGIGSGGKADISAIIQKRESC